MEEQALFGNPVLTGVMGENKTTVGQGDPPAPGVLTGRAGEDTEGEKGQASTH